MIKIDRDMQILSNLGFELICWLSLSNLSQVGQIGNLYSHCKENNKNYNKLS